MTQSSQPISFECRKCVHSFEEQNCHSPFLSRPFGGWLWLLAQSGTAVALEIIADSRHGGFEGLVSVVHGLRQRYGGGVFASSTRAEVREILRTLLGVFTASIPDAPGISESISNHLFIVRLFRLLLWRWWCVRGLVVVVVAAAVVVMSMPLVAVFFLFIAAPC